MKTYNDTRGIVAWNTQIPTRMKKHKLSHVNPECRTWHIELKGRDIARCPFCGENAPYMEAHEERIDEEEDKSQSWSGAVSYQMICLSCSGAGPEAQSEDEAIEEWSLRDSYANAKLSGPVEETKR